MMCILVADDNTGLRRALKELLEAHSGWQVVEAANGREAVEKASQLTPEVVILDITMPELDGISAVPLIRQAAPGAETLILSQHDAPPMVQGALEAGACGYVLKSRAGRDLLRAVKAASEHRFFLSAELLAIGTGTRSREGVSADSGPGSGSRGSTSAKRGKTSTKGQS